MFASSKMTAKKSILLIGEKDHTNKHIAQRLSEQFALAHYSYFEMNSKVAEVHYDLIVFNLDFEANISIQHGAIPFY